MSHALRPRCIVLGLVGLVLGWLVGFGLLTVCLLVVGRVGLGVGGLSCGGLVRGLVAAGRSGWGVSRVSRLGGFGGL